MVFFEISYSDILQHCLPHSGGKAHEKTWGTQIWVKRAQNEGFFFQFSHVCSISFH